MILPQTTFHELFACFFFVCFFTETKFWFIIHKNMVFLLYLEVDVGVSCMFVLLSGLLILQLFYEKQTQRVYLSSVINTGIKLQSIK